MIRQYVRLSITYSGSREIIKSVLFKNNIDFNGQMYVHLLNMLQDSIIFSFYLWIFLFIVL